jgi:hypothetical protein
VSAGIAPDLKAYLDQHHWLFDEFARELGKLGPTLAMSRVEGLAEANTPLGIVNHVAGVTRAYVLGIACGLGVERDRDLEFRAVGVTPESVVKDLADIESAMVSAFFAFKPNRLEILVDPPRSLYGLGEPHPMTPREAIVENIRHAGIHLGELRLTRALLVG